MNLSVGILTFNSENHIEKVLKSVQGIADEIVVLDSGSTDRTLEIVKSFRAKIFYRKFDNFVSQKNHLLSLCSCEWILFLDDDEVVGEELKREILFLKQKPSCELCDGYYVNRLTNYLGRWIRHAWYPDWQLRLVKKEKAIWRGGEVHEFLEVSGKKCFLKGFLYHYSYDSISQHLNKVNLYSTLYARSAFNRGKRFSILKFLLSPLFAFLRRFLLKRGFLDGFEGFVLSVMASYYTFLKYLKLWELERNEKTRSS